MAETVAKPCFQVESTQAGFLDDIGVSLNIYSQSVPYRHTIHSFLTRFFGRVEREGQASPAGTPGRSAMAAG
jgi:hypothetical protein